MITAYSRGWEIYLDGTNWRYTDTNEIENASRSCRKCGRKSTKEGYDACLGYIPGATSACCGHGVEEPYAILKNSHLKGGKNMDFKVIATDFDGTLCENKWPEIGAPNVEIINYLKRQKSGGDVKLILWTCRAGDRLSEATNWCVEQGLSFDAINANIPEIIEEFGSDTRKVFAHEYIDDRMSTRFRFPFIQIETGITDETLGKLEHIFGFPLHDWQKQYLFFRNYLRDLNTQLIEAGFRTNAQEKKYFEGAFPRVPFFERRKTMNIKELCAKYGISLEELGDIGEISDGYHTFNSLYRQRCILFAALCNTFKDLAWKSRKHSNGEEWFGGGWFIVGIDTPDGSYTYHYKDEFWDMFKCQELECAKEWDSHTGNDVERLLSLNDHEEKSNMKSWAEREIEIACKHERAGNDTPDGECDYGCACYESALKAFKSLSGDGHSGFSIGMTKHILNRLIDGKPLTPIEDTPDIWNDISEYRPEEGYRDYQCKRMSSLFKYVYDDGRIKYKDVNSFYCIDANTQSTYHSGLVQRIMDEMFPISMPYMPGSPIKVYCSNLLTNRKNGDFDTVAIFYAIKPDGERVEINRFFKEGEKDWVEIDGVEYALRQGMEAQRKETEEKVFKPVFMNKEFHIPDATDNVKS